jgi:hypothetical protein
MCRLFGESEIFHEEPDVYICVLEVLGVVSGRSGEKGAGGKVVLFAWEGEARVGEGIVDVVFGGDEAVDSWGCEGGVDEV